MTIVDTIKSLPETLKKVEIADLQKQATEFAQGTIESAKGTYADVTKRGEDLVTKAKGLKVEDLKKTVASLRTKAEEGVEDVQKKAEETVAKVTGQPRRPRRRRLRPRRPESRTTQGVAGRCDPPRYALFVLDFAGIQGNLLLVLSLVLLAVKGFAVVDAIIRPTSRTTGR